MSSNALREQLLTKFETETEGIKPAFSTSSSVQTSEPSPLKVQLPYNENINFERNGQIQPEIKKRMNHSSQIPSEGNGTDLKTQEKSPEKKDSFSKKHFGDSNNFVGYRKQTNLLESIKFRCPLMEPYLTPQQFDSHFYPNIGNYFSYEDLFPKTLYVSNAFLPSSLNNIQIPSYPNILIAKTKIKPRLKYKKITQMENPNKKITPPKKEEYINLIKLIFNIPDNFLNEFELRKINVQKIQLSKENPIPSNRKKFSFKEMGAYLNNLCQKIQNKICCESMFDKDYIKYETEYPDKIGSNFLQRKRKSSRDLSEENAKYKIKLGYKNYTIKRQPLKKKCKKKNNKITRKIYKLNNSKNGKKITVNLNQIQTYQNRLYLEKFPFHPLLNTKEVTKITFLKGLVERKDVIRVNKKEILSKEKFDPNNINNKRFELIYQKNDENIKYIICINGINILYIILYYYYQIHKSIRQINVYHYAHAAFYKFIAEINKIEELIKTCNKLVDEISKMI